MSVSPLQLVPAGSSLLTRGLVLGYYCSMVYEFTLFSSMVEGRVIICSVSMVLRLEILIDNPCLARSLVVARDLTIPLLPLYPTSR
jgi:hypothetical protein